MNYIDFDDVAGALPYDELVESLREIYRAEGMSADRHLVDLESINSTPGTCIAFMPAWGPGHNLTTKIFTIFPDNSNLGLPTIYALILVLDPTTGKPKAILDGTEVTRRRTACMSALAADYLARPDSRNLVVCGAGALAPHAAMAHASVRPIETIGIWARRAEAAESVVQYLQSQRQDLDIYVVDDLADACQRADIVSSQTSSPDPIVFGKWISPGTHMDFVGSHESNRRECDDEAARRSRIFVDVMETAMKEAGDILIPLRSGVIDQKQIIGDLSDLAGERVSGRKTNDEVTLFKSTGSSLADMAAAELVVKNMSSAS